MSGSLDHALAVARRLRAGFIGLNGGAGYGADVPFGGYKASGVGRQNGTAGFDQYTEIKSVAYPAPEGVFLCSFSTISRTSASSTISSRAMCATRTPNSPGCGARNPCSASRFRVCRAKKASPSSWCIAMKTPSRCCGTTRLSRPRSSSRRSAMSSASTSCSAWTSRSTAGTGRWCQRRSRRRRWRAGRTSWWARSATR